MKRIQYDDTVDALYIELRARAKSARTQRVTDELRIDFDTKGRAIGVEILNASRHADADFLASAATAGEKLSLVEASERSGLDASTLRWQIHKGKLRGSKLGRDWFVDAGDLETYLEAVESRRDQAARKTASKGARSPRSAKAI